MKQEQDLLAVITVDLLSNKKCLINGLPYHLSRLFVHNCQLFRSPKSNCYLTSINELNYLRRALQEHGLFIQDIPHHLLQLYINLAKKQYNKRSIPQELGPWTLLPHQIDFVGFFLRKGRHIVIGEDWGRGKTVSSLAIAAVLKVKRTVVVCNKYLLEHWFYHATESQIWSHQKITSKADNLFWFGEGCLIIQEQQINILWEKRKKIDFLIVDEPQHQPRQYQFIQQCKYALLIVRNAFDKMQRWLPYFKNDITLDFICTRYSVKGSKPCTHIHEYRQLQELVYSSALKNQHSFVSKAVVLPILSGLEIKELTQRQLEGLYQKHLSWIKGYLLFHITAHRQPLFIVYRFRKNGLTLKSQLSEVKNNVHLVSYDQLNEKASKNIVIMLEPYLVKQEDLAKFVISKIASYTHKIEYFQLRLEENLKHLQFELIYPKIYENIELSLAGSTYKREKQADRKRTVFYDRDQEQIQVIQQTSRFAQTIGLKSTQANKSQQIQPSLQMQSTKQLINGSPQEIFTNNQKLTYSTFNIFNNHPLSSFDQRNMHKTPETRKEKFK